MPRFTTCEAKVLRVDNAIEIANGEKLQHVWVADSSGMARITIWDNDVDSLATNEIYKYFRCLDDQREQKYLLQQKPNAKYLKFKGTWEEMYII